MPSFAYLASQHILIPFINWCFLKAEILFMRLCQNLLNVFQYQMNSNLFCRIICLKLIHCHFYHELLIYVILLFNHQSFFIIYLIFSYNALIILITLFQIYQLFTSYDLHFWEHILLMKLLMVLQLFQHYLLIFNWLMVSIQL